MATFYSLRNLLESGGVKNNDKNNQFLASVVTTYPCLDMWVRPQGQNEVEVRVMYMQCNSGYFADAAQPWTRDGEEPKVYQQYRGDWAEIRSQIVSHLPQLSRLSDEKRHGLSNFGAKQPFDKSGLLFSYDNASGVLTLQGRFGGIIVTSGAGVQLPYESLNFSFNCCEVEVDVEVDSGYGLKECGILGICVDVTPAVVEKSVTLDIEARRGSVSAIGPPAGSLPFCATNVFQWPSGTSYGVPQGTLVDLPAPTDSGGIYDPDWDIIKQTQQTTAAINTTINIVESDFTNSAVFTMAAGNVSSVTTNATPGDGTCSTSFSSTVGGIGTNVTGSWTFTRSYDSVADETTMDAEFTPDGAIGFDLGGPWVVPGNVYTADLGISSHIGLSTGGSQAAFSVNYEVTNNYTVGSASETTSSQVNTLTGEYSYGKLTISFNGTGW